MRTLLFFACLLLSLPIQAASTTDMAEAKRLSRAGATAYRAGDYQGALEHFQHANRLVPHPNFEVNIGRAYENLGRPDKALLHCKLALSSRHSPAQTRRAATSCIKRVEPKAIRPRLSIATTPAGAHLLIDNIPQGKSPWSGQVDAGPRKITLNLGGYKTLTRTIEAKFGESQSLTLSLTVTDVGGLLTIDSAPGDALVTLDGDEMGRTPLSNLQVGAGVHTVEVSLAGYAPQVSTVAIADGKHLRRSVTLVPLGVDGRPYHTRAQWPGWALVGAGVVAVSAGGYFGYQALQHRTDASNLARTSTAPEDRIRYNQMVSDMEASRLSADVLFLSGAAALVGGTTWLLWPEAGPVAPGAMINF